MKLRVTLLTLVSVLLIASLAGAATIDVPAAPAAPVAAASPAEASPLCLTQTSDAQLPPGHPPLLKVSICGACSDTRCRNNTLGNVCASGGYTCQNVYGNFCAQDGLSACTCTNRPPF
jgi:hypothetical protein